MNGEDKSTQALAREVGRHSVERLNEGLGRILVEASALFRWLLTMVFLLNAGGFWFCFAYPEAVAAGRHDALVSLFGVGALVALLAALVSFALTVPVARAMRGAISHWTEVSVSGAFSDEAGRHARRVKWASMLWLSLASLIGLGSLALFLAGAKIASSDFAALDRALGFPPVEQAATPEPVVTNAADVLPPVANAAVNVGAVPATPAPAPVPERGRSAPARAAAPAPKPTPRPSPSSRPAQPRAPVATPTPSAPTQAAPPAPVVTPPTTAPTQ